VRRQPTSRVAARRHRLHPRLRLRGRQGRLGFLRAPARGRSRQRHARRQHRPRGRADVPPGRARLRRRETRRGRLGDLCRHERERRRVGARRPRCIALEGACPGGRRHVARAEHDQAERPPGRNRTTDARPEPHPHRRDPLRRHAKRGPSTRGSRRVASRHRALALGRPPIPRRPRLRDGATGAPRSSTPRCSNAVRGEEVSPASPPPLAVRAVSPEFLCVKPDCGRPRLDIVRGEVEEPDGEWSSAVETREASSSLYVDELSPVGSPGKGLVVDRRQVIAEGGNRSRQGPGIDT
jgi:hypothetical protein